MVTVTLRPASTLTIVELAALLSAAFADYFVPMATDAGALAARLRCDGVDLERSLCADLDGAPVGLTLIAPRGWSARIAAMGVVAGARGRGVGGRMIDAAIDGLRASGFRELRLEVIAENTAAIALYEAVGLERRRRLVGYNRAPAAPPRSSASLVEVDPCEVASAVARHGEVDLPWQLRAESLVAHGPPARGFRAEDGAWALTTIGGDASLVLLALVVAAERRASGLARALVDGLAAAHVGRRLRIPQRAPEGLGAAALDALGFEVDPLTQWEMTGRLDG